MEKNIKVSIIVPAYNVEGYIEDCLNSLIKQTLQEIEIIVINDGSTDKTGEIIAKFAKKDSRIIAITQENKGLSGARNTGLEIVKGEYIGFVDSDDWVDSNYFEKLYNSAKEEDADMAVASILKHKPQYNRYNVQFTKPSVATSIQEKVRICQDKTKRFFYVWNKLCKTELIKNNNLFFPEGRIYEDVLFTMQTIYNANKIVSVIDTEYHYIERSTSILKSKGKSEKKLNDHKVAYIELQDFAKKHNIKLPERLNYIESYWKTPLLKIYDGKYKKKITLFGILTIFKYNKKGA